MSSKAVRTSPLDLAQKAARAAGDKKGRDLALHRVEGLVHYADYFVFATGTNRRQVQAIADELENLADDLGLTARVEGYASGWWVLVDLGDVVVHVLQPEARSYYDLDHLWADAPTVAVAPEKSKRSIRDARIAR